MTGGEDVGQRELRRAQESACEAIREAARRATSRRASGGPAAD